MAANILGRKVGMTRVFTAEGINVPVTVIEAGPCLISQIKTEATDGYTAIQVGFEDIKPRRSTMAQIGHDHKAGVSPKRIHSEFRIEAGDIDGYELGQALTVEAFEGVGYVDVTGTSRGRGFAGGMKRWGFKGQQASHGVKRRHRSPGSIGGHANNAGGGGGIKKGKKMSGHFGDKQITVRSLDVLGIDKENNLILVKGPVPGAKNGLLEVREATRLYKVKANLLKKKG